MVLRRILMMLIQDLNQYFTYWQGTHSSISKSLKTVAEKLFVNQNFSQTLNQEAALLFCGLVAFAKITKSLPLDYRGFHDALSNSAALTNLIYKSLYDEKHDINHEHEKSLSAFVFGDSSKKNQLIYCITQTLINANQINASNNN